MGPSNHDQSYTYTADLLSGPLFFGAIGYGLDRWLYPGGHRWVIAGLILGIVMGLYAVLIRYRRAVAALEQSDAVPTAHDHDASFDPSAKTPEPAEGAGTPSP